ncbi:TrmH family RNA methyltransferase [Apilactobacillus timberlakei]|uniref:RNA methyltransferase n=1 Tax=Apilactobacillus timberlakei TaxID=2008380 RepID=A0ABY2YY52_9LACO|nr:RNA methyltransferase [Apilactobacillus timberlakei]TPR15338.1 RNA methyltransferase [Apilactobacillus timberlakei]TPR17229.1 RNA methyltransferase [Apilactobacillus timberlakei]TPR20241.1 RNA methyltransferase [Apilactobacillus timberlakei]TPR21959.1 RNA methyltransferase [Apilactobacillus timberlakei]TPR22360.1 RNA methyltransferase [Apilactobacillus timberlakei]
MEKIISVKNDRIKAWKKLSNKKGREKQSAYLLESWHLVNEALNANQDIKVILTTAKQLTLHQNELSYYNSELIEINDEVAKYLGSTITPQGIFAIVGLPSKEDINENNINGSWLLLDNIQDPGNIGTMVRTADAAGMSGVIFGKGTSSQFNPKVLRSMQGSQFHLKIIEGNLLYWIDILKDKNYQVYGSELNEDAFIYNEIVPSENFALIMGNEGNGMQDDLLKITDKNLYIPIKGNAESLNVAIASGILMFHLKK